MPEDGLETLAGFDEIYLGTVGWPTVPDHVSLWRLLLPIRHSFDQYVNLRPIRLLRGVEGPLRIQGAGALNEREAHPEWTWQSLLLVRR